MMNMPLIASHSFVNTEVSCCHKRWLKSVSALYIYLNTSNVKTGVRTTHRNVHSFFIFFFCWFFFPKIFCNSSPVYFPPTYPYISITLQESKPADFYVSFSNIIFFLELFKLFISLKPVNLRERLCRGREMVGCFHTHTDPTTSSASGVGCINTQPYTCSHPQPVTPT